MHAIKENCFHSPRPEERRQPHAGRIEVGAVAAEQGSRGMCERRAANGPRFNEGVHHELVPVATRAVERRLPERACQVEPSVCREE